jgi:excisionase family DNA binding protein
MSASTSQNRGSAGIVQSRLSEGGDCFETLLTVADVAELLRVPVSWVYERTRRRGSEQIPHLKLGKYLRFCHADVTKWLESMRGISLAQSLPTVYGKSRRRTS